MSKVNEKGGMYKKYLIYGAVAVFVPLLGVALQFINSGITISEFNPLWNSGNDEVIYYKMVQGISEYGMPIGYFGYNESHAVIGHFSTWSPFLLIFWGIFSKVFGWSYYSPCICNVLVLLISLFLFSVIVTPTYRRLAFFAVFLVGVQFVIRCCLLILPEISVYSLCLIVIALNMSVYENPNGNNQYRMVILLFLTELLFLMRPFYGFLMICPIYYSVRRNGIRNIKTWLYVAYMITSVILYYVVYRFMCAPYFSDLLRVDLIHSFFVDPIGTVQEIFDRFITGSTVVCKSISEIQPGKVNDGVVFFVYVIIFIYSIFELLMSIIKKKKNKTVIWIYYVIYMAVFHVAITVFFGVLAKHYIEIILIGVVLISMYADRREGVVVSAILIILCVTLFNTKLYKVDNSEFQSIIEARNVIEEKIDIHDVLDPYDATILWLHHDDVGGVWWHGLYAMPAGVGISCCLPDYVENNFDTLKARYIYCNKKSNIANMCEQYGWNIVYDFGDTQIFERI